MESDLDLKRARASLDEFAALLAAKPKESEWQRLFSSNPHILSQALPLRLEPGDIRPGGRPGQSEADFIIHPRAVGPIPFYGVIELKRNDASVVRVKRADLLELTSDAQTAVRQAQNYARKLRKALLVGGERSLILGNPAYNFIIMGMSDEIARKVAEEVLAKQMAGLLPGGCHLVNYDQLFEQFKASIPPTFLQLVPALPSFPRPRWDLNQTSRLLDRLVQSKPTRPAEPWAAARSPSGSGRFCVVADGLASSSASSEELMRDISSKSSNDIQFRAVSYSGVGRSYGRYDTHRSLSSLARSLREYLPQRPFDSTISYVGIGIGSNVIVGGLARAMSELPTSESSRWASSIRRLVLVGPMFRAPTWMQDWLRDGARVIPAPMAELMAGGDGPYTVEGLRIIRQLGIPVTVILSVADGLAEYDEGLIGSLTQMGAEVIRVTAESTGREPFAAHFSTYRSPSVMRIVASLVNS